MFHMLGYFVSAGVTAANTDAAALTTDSVFSQRNSHYIFSEEYQLLGASYLATSATRARFNVPTWNALARQQIWPINRAATPGSFPRVHDLRDYPIRFPLSEEIAVEVSNDLAMGSESATVFLWVSIPNWNRNLTRGRQRIMVRCTSSVARVANTWSGLGNLTFAENLRGGWYSVVGAFCFSANLRAFRLFFPRSNYIANRQLRPGMLTAAALGNLEVPDWNSGMGEWGRFHTFEPPMIEVYGDAGGADTQEVRLDLVYHGETPPY